MYHTITPITSSHNPIIIEQEKPVQLIVFNAGPANIQADVWTAWEGKKEGRFPENADEPNFRLELRAGNEKIISGAFVRIKIKESINPT